MHVVFLHVCQAPGVQGIKFDRLLKEEALQSEPEISESEGWGVRADGEQVDTELEMIT